MLRRLLPIIGFAAFVAATLPVAAQTFSPTQRDQIGAIVKDYLLKNPEVIQDAIAELERRNNETQKVAQATALKEANNQLLRSPHSTVTGNLNGDVTLVEFFDYNCGYCKRALSDVQALVKGDPKLRVVLKDFPVLGPESLEASKIALAVRGQISGDKLFDYHARLLNSRGRVNGERALAVAKEMGLDLARLRSEAEGAEVKAALSENAELGEKLGLTGTPAFIIGQEVVSGAVGVDPLRKVIADARR